MPIFWMAEPSSAFSSDFLCFKKCNDVEIGIFHFRKKISFLLSPNLNASFEKCELIWLWRRWREDSFFKLHFWKNSWHAIFPSFFQETKTGSQKLNLIKIWLDYWTVQMSKKCHTLNELSRILSLLQIGK